MSLVLQPSNNVFRTSTVLTAGGADVVVVTTGITHVEAVLVVSGPADAFIKFGGTTAAAIPVSANDPGRSNLDVPVLYGSSSTGGTLVLEVHGR